MAATPHLNQGELEISVPLERGPELLMLLADRKEVSAGSDKTVELSGVNPQMWAQGDMG